MSKFYVQCGPLQLILLADTVEQAALAALDRSMQCHSWVYDDATLSEQDCYDHLVVEALLHLDVTMRISERGFDRADAIHVGTPETIQQWHQLMLTIRKMFASAGANRSMSAVACGDAPTTSPLRRRPR